MAYFDVVNKKDIDTLPQEGVTLVDVWAPWCGPCRMIGPVIEKIATESNGRWNVVKIEADSNQDILMEYGIRSIPTLIVLKDGKEVHREIGFKQKEVLEGILENWSE